LAAFNKFNLTVQNLVRGVHNLNSDAVLVALYTAAVAPAATDIVYATTLSGGAVENTTGNGYTAGGNSGGASISSNSGGTETVKTTSAIPVWTASTAGFSLRYVVAYNNTTALKNLLGWWDYGSTLTLNGANGDTFTVTGLNTSIFTLV
jgi:hypothetical protein